MYPFGNNAAEFLVFQLATDLLFSIPSSPNPAFLFRSWTGLYGIQAALNLSSTTILERSWICWVSCVLCLHSRNVVILGTFIYNVQAA